MFTGIIRDIGVVKEARRSALEVSTSLPCEISDSVAVNGACLTVSKKTRGGRKARVLRFDVSSETLRRTNLGSLRPGAAVNLEPALRAGEELGGHLVGGHVDAQGEILALEALPGGFKRLRVRLPPALAGLVALKGSIAVDGVSLTPTAVSRSSFETVLVPHTLKATNLSRRRAGESVNLEADLIARYVQAAIKP